MKDVLVRAGSSLLAAVIGYIVLTVLSDTLATPAKLGIAAALGIAAFGVSVWASNGTPKDMGAVKVASNLKGQSAHIEDVGAEVAQGQSAHVASDIEVTGAIEIKGANVKSTKESK